MSKRFLSIFLCAAMILTVSTGCSDSTANSTTSQPSSTDVSAFSTPTGTITMTGFGCSFPGQASWGDMLLFEELEKRTGVHIDWEYMEQSPQTTERVNMMFASGDMPEIFIRAGQGATDRATVVKWGNSGLVLDMASLIKEHAPHIQAMFDKYPAIRASNTTPDGKIYVLPTVYDYDVAQVFRTFQINTNWLQRVSKEEPQTLDEFLDVLRAFRDQDANGNGDAIDEVPYSAHNFEFCMRGILASYGMNWAYNMPAVFTDSSYACAATSDEFKAALECLNLMYKEKLLDPEIFSQTNARFHGMLPDDKYGCVVFGLTSNAGEVVAPQLKTLPPMIGPSGADNRPWSFYTPVVKSDCSSFITKNCKDPVAAIKWLDYLYSEEGSDLVWLGVKDVTYKENEDGTFSYVDDILYAPEGYAKKLGQYSITWGNGTEPGMFTQRQLRPGYENTTMEENVATVKPFLQDVATTPLPIMSADQEEEWQMINEELNPYLKEMWAKFVSGEASFDQWDDYCKTAEQLGLSRAVEMIKEATGL